MPAKYPAHLSDFAWSLVTSVKTVPGFGFNSFDLAFPGSLNANPLSLGIGPGCGRVSDVRIRALTRPDSNTWETGAAFDGVAAYFSSPSIRFLRVSFQDDGTASECAFALYGAQAAAAAPSPAAPAGGLWYCQASPFNNPQINLFYWYNQSVDFARYQALSACAGSYGAVCSVTCQPPAG